MVASSSHSDMIKSNLQRVGVWEFFDGAVGGNEIKNGKPAPYILLKAAECIGLTPTDCYVFEVSLNGVRAAAAANSVAVMIPDQVPPTEEIEKIATAIYPSLVDALKAIKNGDL